MSNTLLLETRGVHRYSVTRPQYNQVSKLFLQCNSQLHNLLQIIAHDTVINTIVHNYL